MAVTLPRLRLNLDIMPSPLSDRPGLLIRDPFRYSDATLIVPPVLSACLQCYDGEHTDLDLREMLFRAIGHLQTGEIAQHLTDSLRNAGFLEDEVYEKLRAEAHERFATAARREAEHAGSAYPAEPEALREKLQGYLAGPESDAASQDWIGIAAPHVSPEGGWRSYREAYGRLGPQLAGCTFVILGTSHYGQTERFGLTRKPFQTPLGEAQTDTELVDRLARAAPGAVEMEDYCHATEHSVEFQVVFLQQIFGAGIRIAPVLCGPFGRSLLGGGLPEDDENVRRFLGALGEVAAARGRSLFWILGIDMAHMGRRYGDSFSAQADQGAMQEVAVRDSARIAQVCAGQARGFWEMVQENRDDLKWCGSSPLYTFLKAVPEARASLLRYEQWNIDPSSVVSFGAVGFTAG